MTNGSIINITNSVLTATAEGYTAHAAYFRHVMSGASKVIIRNTTLSAYSANQATDSLKFVDAITDGSSVTVTDTPMTSTSPGGDDTAWGIHFQERITDSFITIARCVVRALIPNGGAGAYSLIFDNKDIGTVNLDGNHFTGSSSAGPLNSDITSTAFGRLCVEGCYWNSAAPLVVSTYWGYTSPTLNVTGNLCLPPCEKGYWGSQCDRICPVGLVNPCNNNGICEQGGMCTCFMDSHHGRWTGWGCDICADGYYGSNCSEKCLCFTEGTASCDQGRVGTGICTCKQGWSGNLCAICDPIFVAGCLDRTCPGNPICNNEGWCKEERTINGDIRGVCQCNATYGATDCGTRCPMGPVNGQACNGHGECHDMWDGDGTCTCNGTFAAPDCITCKKGYWGGQCDHICPGGLVNPCNNNGTCEQYGTGDGTCTCNGVYSGTECDTPCPFDHNGVCGGHGICDVHNPVCTCSFNSTAGYWQLASHATGQLCTECDDAYGGATCLTACPSVDNNGIYLVCNGTGGIGGTGRGYCNKTSGTCACRGNFCGRQCEGLLEIKPGTNPVEYECRSCKSNDEWGLNCENKCTCMHGECNNGKAGDGSCFCDVGWAGAHCSNPCPGGSVNPCSGNGNCLPLQEKCDCDSGYAGTVCDIQCPGFPLGSCSNHGTCNDGANNDGTCKCDVGWAWNQTGCSTACDCSLHGHCPFPDPLCLCDGNYVGAHCDACAPGFSNVNCTGGCAHGDTVGYTCMCHAGWGGEECNIQCPTAHGGKICSEQGTCLNSTGQCLCTTFGHVGPACECSRDQCQNAFNTNYVCNVTSGGCICATHRAGSDCQSCVEGRFGTDCLNRCSLCNSPCDRDTGRCVCYASEEKGFWQGMTCNDCAEGYMPPTCTIPSNSSHSGWSQSSPAGNSGSSSTSEPRGRSGPLSGDSSSSSSSTSSIHSTNTTTTVGAAANQGAALDNDTGLIVGLTVGSLLLLLLLCLLVCCVIHRRRKEKQDERGPTGDSFADGIQVNPLVASSSGKGKSKSRKPWEPNRNNNQFVFADKDSMPLEEMMTRRTHEDDVAAHATSLLGSEDTSNLSDMEMHERLLTLDERYGNL